MSSIPNISPALQSFAVPIGDLVPDRQNVNTHPQRNMEVITESLRKFGQQAPVVYVLKKTKKTVIKGNGLLAAAKGLGWKEIAAVKSDLDGNDATAFAIVDNRSAKLSEFDDALLAAQLQELEEMEFDISCAGFSDEELQELVESVEDDRPGRPAGGGEESRHRGERTALVLVGHLKFELPRKEFDAWLGTVEGKVGNDPDRVIREIKRRLKLKS